MGGPPFSVHWVMAARIGDHMTAVLSLPAATRVEVIDPYSGRAFLGQYDRGMSVHVQDGGRTVKVFADVLPAVDDASGDLTHLQGVVASALAAAAELLDNPEYGGSLVDVIADRVYADRVAARVSARAGLRRVIEEALTEFGRLGDAQVEGPDEVDAIIAALTSSGHLSPAPSPLPTLVDSARKA